MNVREQKRARLSLKELPERGALEVETFADASLGILNRIIHLVVGDIDKPGRNFRQKHFEAQLGFEFFTQAFFRFRHCPILL
jgi:hypothetical protein